MSDEVDRKSAWWWVPWAGLLLAAIILLEPALRPVHVEGFSASMVALGLHVAQGTVPDFLPSAPFTADYFGLTKLGVVLAIAGLSPVIDGDLTMRVLMWVGTILLLAGSALLIRRWSGGPWLTAIAVLLLMPGIVESSYFFNDNVPAAGLLMTALALLSPPASWLRSLIAGLLIGAAVAIRTDLVLIAAPTVLLILTERQRLKVAALHASLAAGAALVMLFGLFILVGTTPLDALRAGAHAVELWDRPTNMWRQAGMFVYFCGPPAFFLFLVGVGKLVRERQWRRLALGVGVPLFVNLVLFGKMWEARQFLALAPFIGLPVAIAIRLILDDVRAGRRVAAIAATLLVAVSLFAPAGGLIISDGPRLLNGRIAGLGLWHRWQAGVRADFERINAAIDTAPMHRTSAILTDGWNDDRFLHLELVRRGFHRVALPAACGSIAEGMQRGNVMIAQITLRASFVLDWPFLQPERFERLALPCLAALRPERVLILGNEDRIALWHPAPPAPGAADPDLQAAGVSRIVWAPMDRSAFLALIGYFRRETITATMARRHSLASEEAANASLTPFSR